MTRHALAAGVGTVLALAASPLASTAPLAAQVTAHVGRYLETDAWDTYRLGWQRTIAGPLGSEIYGQFLGRRGDASLGLAGMGGDLTLFRGGAAGPYLAAGLGAGLTTTDELAAWAGWSAGIGYELIPLSWLRLGADVRYRGLSLGRREGVELSLGLGLHFGGRGRAAPRPEPARGPASGAPAVSEIGSADDADDAEGATLARRVIATAVAEMGTRYQFGGVGEDGDGFDCSGLIQHAYGEHGIALPRRSVDQAREGRPVEKRVDALRPGDILTFSNAGGRVTHVGLYVGDGRFIHSATSGVRESLLTESDPDGRWWYRRWVGARRIVEG